MADEIDNVSYTFSKTSADILQKKTFITQKVHSYPIDLNKHMQLTNHGDQIKSDCHCIL